MILLPRHGIALLKICDLRTARHDCSVYLCRGRQPDRSGQFLKPSMQVSSILFGDTMVPIID